MTSVTAIAFTANDVCEIAAAASPKTIGVPLLVPRDEEDPDGTGGGRDEEWDI